MTTRGFKSSRPRGDPSRVPPGQYVTSDFPSRPRGHFVELRGILRV